MKIKVVKGIGQFEELKPTWSQLFEQCEFPTVFQTWEWLFTWWRHFSKNKELLILLAYEEPHQLVGIAPLYIAKKKFGLQTLRTVEFIGLGENRNSEYLDFIINKVHRNKSIRAFLATILKLNICDVVNLTNLSKKTGTVKLLMEVSKELNKVSYIEDNLSCPYIDLPETMDIFLKTIKSRQRGRLKNQRNRLHKRYSVEVICWNNGEKISEGMDLLFELHDKRFGSKSVFTYEENKPFNKDVARSFFERGILNLYFLKLNGEFAATMYCFKLNNRLLYYQTGYDPKWIKLSALKILIYNVIERSIEANLDRFDFGRGREQYKTEWTKCCNDTNDILLFMHKYSGCFFKIQKVVYNAIKRVVRALK